MIKLIILAFCATAVAHAGIPAAEPPTTTREIYVPVSDLKVLLESEPHRVLLTRQEYDELLKKAKKTPETHVPHASLLVSSDYEIVVEDGRAKLHGTIAIDVLDDGLQAVPLDFGGVGLQAARLDNQPAPLGHAADGRLNLLVAGKGRHQLAVDMIAPLEMNSAQQCLRFRVTNAAVGRWRLTVPGDVEIKSGADVVSRKVDGDAPDADKAARSTRFELLPHSGDTAIFMSLNSHLQRDEQAVAARCVLFDEVTEAYEKLHATVTLWILHRAVDHFRLVVPEGFEITEINSPLLARWKVATEAGRKIVDVWLREQTTDTVVLSLVAIKTPSRLKDWRMPRLELLRLGLLDYVGQVTVLGVLVQDSLKAESLAADGALIPVDTMVLAAALPASLVQPEPGAVPLRYIAAYYAPQVDYKLTADFRHTPAALAVTTNLLLNIQDKGCEVQGGFALLPAAEKRFSFDFSVPAGWSVTEVTAPDKSPLPIERYVHEKLPGRVHVKLPQGIAPGQVYGVGFRARSTPPGWLDTWRSQSVEFPMFRVADAERDEGAVAVTADEDMEVKADNVERLVPITAAEMARFGLASGATSLAFRYEGAAGKATIVANRVKSRGTARTFAFFQIAPEVIKAHYVVIYTIEDAKTRRLALLLPASTPEKLTISGLNGVSVKDYVPEPAGTMRRWNVLLDDARRDEVRLAVDFEMRRQLPSPSGRGSGGEGSTDVGAAKTPSPSGKGATQLPSPSGSGRPQLPSPSGRGSGGEGSTAAKLTELKDFALPLLTAADVVYQSGRVAIEGEGELGVDIHTKLRRADVGKLAIARYTPASLDLNPKQPGDCGPKASPMRFLGAYEFVGDPPKPEELTVDVYRNPSYALTPAIVQRARLTTFLSADGWSQTKASFELRTKAPYLEIELPENATLWSAVLEQQPQPGQATAPIITPLKPQKRGGVCLIGLPADASGAARSLQLVYEAPVQSLAKASRLSLSAPRLLYRASRDAKQSTEIPLVNIQWTVTVPDGYEAVATDGTLEAKPIARPVPAPLVVAGGLYELAGGIHELGSAMSPAAAKSKAENKTKQIGMGFQDYASTFENSFESKEARVQSPQFTSPTRRKALSQNIDAADMDTAERGEAEKAEESKTVEMPKADAKPAEARPPTDAAAPAAPAPVAGPKIGELSGAGSLTLGGLAHSSTAPAPAPGLPPVALGNGTLVITPTPAPATVPVMPLPPITTPATPSDGGFAYEATTHAPAAVATPAPPAPAPAVAAPPPAPRAPASEAKPDVEHPMDVARNPGVAAGKPVYQQRGIAEAVGDWGVAVGKPVYQQQDLSGFRSLNIDVQQAQMDGRQVLTFNSLGASPQVGITLARRNRNTFLTWGLALAVFVLGMAMTTRPVRQKAAFVLVLALASALLPLAWDTVSFARICNGVFFAASLLVPYYLLAGLIRWILQGLRALANRLTGPTSASAAASIVLVLAILLSAAAQAQPQPAAPEPPVTVPEDAIIVPYDVKSQTGIQDANRLLVPYERYVELWNRAYPDKKIDAHPAPLPYALSGATYSAVLEGEETLNISGKLQIDVLAEGYISIPLGLRGGVLANAELDGKPARLKVVATDGSPNVPGTRRVPMKSGGTRSAPDTMDATLLVIQVSGKGTHKLALEARLKLDHLGGWRGTRGSLPTAPAATITLRVPQAQTEVRLGQAVDRRSHETQRPDETLETALGTDGALQVQWRPKVAEGEVDRGLTVQSAGLLDVQEDGLRMGLHFQLEFRRSQRDTFTLLLPADFLVEKVAGGNVRGWKVRREAKKQTVDVSLLKTAKDAEQFNLFLSCNGKVGQALLDSFVVPMVTVSGAALSSGQLTIRRSPLLDLRTTERSGGVTRTDLGALPDLSGGPATEESVLAIRPYEAYHFPTMPFVLRLSAARVLADVTAEAQTSVRLDPTEPGLESKIVFHVGQRKTYGFEIALPDGLRLPEVTLPSSGIWSIEKVPPQTPQEKPRSVLKIFLQQGVLGDLAVILRGKLPALDGQELSLPRLDVLGVKRQEGQIAVQTDEAFSVQARELRDCRETELERVAAWLDPQLRAATRLALQYTGGAYAGKLRLTPRTPEVACDTVTNVKITDRAIEETIVLNYTISNAGIRELSFLLPASMADARILANMLRRKTVSPVDPKATGSPVRVHLEFQGDVMNELRVQVQNDRLLTPGTPEAPNVAPLPTFENVAGRGADSLRHQWVVLETANRDELIEVSQGLQTLGRQQAQWQTLIKYLGSDQFYKAYLVQPGAAKPQLGFYLKTHEDVETAGARIDLALTTIVLDANGAYRAKLELSVDNSSEQFLDVELPEGATLWAAQVAGEPVKAGRLPGAADDRHVLLPVRKTAKGDLDYRVVLKYGGKTPPLSFLSDVQFPLVRHVMPYPSPADRSINIEQSQVKVYVPKSHRWFDFGGTMHRTEDEAELAAGRMAAFNKEGQRLLEATHDNDPFTRIRTAENLKNWLAESQKAQQDAGRVSNKELQSQLSANSSVTQQANDVLKSAGGEVQEGESTVDNRQRLNALYEKQVTVNGNSTLILAGNNTYNGGTTVNAGTLVAQNPVEFNGNWIERNNFNNPGTLVAQPAGQPNGSTAAAAGASTFSGVISQSAGAGLTMAGPGTQVLSGANTYSGPTTISAGQLPLANPNLANGRIILNNDQQSGGQANFGITNGFANPSVNYGAQPAFAQSINPAQMANMAPRVPQSYSSPVPGPVAHGSGEQGAKPAPAQQPPARQSGGRDEQKRELAEYQQKVSMAWRSGQSQGQPQGSKYNDDSNLFDRKGGDKPAPPPAKAAITGNFDMLVDLSNTGLVLDGSGPTAPAGLASLDFELPTDNSLYELFRFTTPRGDAELSARTVSNSTLVRLELLLGIVAAGLAVWAAFALIRRGVLRGFCHPLGAVVLIVAGLVSLIANVLPYAGLLALLAGIVLLIARLFGCCRRKVAA